MKAACHKEVKDPVTVRPPVTQGVSGEVWGIWAKGGVYRVTGHLDFPEGKSLTIESGVKIIMSDSILIQS
jgi:hypothetical protein